VRVEHEAGSAEATGIGHGDPGMKLRWLGNVLALLLGAALAGQAQTYLGFDRNDYPGDENLKALRQTFTFAGYWLNKPPGETSSTWAGKRKVVESAGFGFLVLFNGRLYRELKNTDAATLGRSDAHAAVASAQHEGFPERTILFLDQEEGGRMLPEQKAYIYAWVDGVTAAGFRAGIYSSGIAARERHGASIITANDIRENASGRKIVYFVTNDACPPSPGCAFPRRPPHPSDSGIGFAEAWQFAQSPRRKDVAAACPANYDPDGECYPPGFDASQHLHVDVDTATSPDPSRGRTR
jgi:Rv2525c-like, glycoside hydrolase-like domain